MSYFISHRVYVLYNKNTIKRNLSTRSSNIYEGHSEFLKKDSLLNKSSVRISSQACPSIIIESFTCFRSTRAFVNWWQRPATTGRSRREEKCWKKIDDWLLLIKCSHLSAGYVFPSLHHVNTHSVSILLQRFKRAQQLCNHSSGISLTTADSVEHYWNTKPIYLTVTV